jgi:hypothetical protein
MPEKPKPIPAKVLKSVEQLLAESAALRKKAAALDAKVQTLIEAMRVNAGGSKPKG